MRSLSGARDAVLRMRDDYFRPLTATMLNFAYFSPIINAARKSGELYERCSASMLSQRRITAGP